MILENEFIFLFTTGKSYTNLSRIAFETVSVAAQAAYRK